MALRFSRRIKIARGISINLSKSGASVSLGPRGAKVTIGKKGVRSTVGLPGTGVHLTNYSSYGQSKKKNKKTQRKRVSKPINLKDDDFVDVRMVPRNHGGFVDGLDALANGDEVTAYRKFLYESQLPDAKFMAGVIALKNGRYADAESLFVLARKGARELGRYFTKYGVESNVEIPITEEVGVTIGASVRGVELSLAEVYQAIGQPKRAFELLKRLYLCDKEDIIVRLSLAELLVDQFSGKLNCETVVKLAKDVTNKTECHTALLYFKGKALRKLGLFVAARDSLTSAMSRKKSRSKELLSLIRYERILVYKELGHEKRMRTELEKLYADSPTYKDVARRLGLDS